MKKFFKQLLILFTFLFTLLNGLAQPKEAVYSMFLKDVLTNHDSFWIRINAGEALISNNYDIDVEQLFHNELKKKGVEKTGALSLMFLENHADSIKNDSIIKEILGQFKNAQNEHEKILALKTLGKLGLSLQDEEIIELAKRGNGEIKVLSQWILSNSLDPNHLNVLAGLLSGDPIQFRYAANALRSIEKISSQVYLKMKEVLRVTEEEDSSRVFLISALYVHANEEDKAFFKEELLKYLNGKQYEKHEVYKALNARGSKEDIPLLKKGFREEEDIKVKIAAADAFLTNEHYLQNKVNWIDWCILVIYGISLIWIGWHYSRLQKDQEDYFLGGRNVSSFFSGISLFVSFFSAITYLAIPGEVIRFGPLLALIVIIAGPVIYLIGSYFLIPFFMNLKIISAYEILEKPLGPVVRKFGSSLFLITRLVWMALLIFLASKAMTVMMGWDSNTIFMITILIGVITIVYTTMGGIKAVLLTDVIQFFILLFGALVTIILIAIKFGGFNSLIPTSWSENWTRIEFFNFDPYIRLTIVTAFLHTLTWWICTTGSDQMAIQRFLTTNSQKDARKSFLVTQLGQILIYLLLMFVGFAIFQFYNFSPNLLPSGTNVTVEADFLFPHFIANQLPTGMSGLIIAALFSASMSSLSSGINSISSVFYVDILPRSIRTNSRSKNLKTVKLISGITGVAVVILSLIIPLIPGNIVEVTYKTNGLFIAPLFNLFFMALFIKKAKKFGVIMGSIYGFLVAFTIAFWDILTDNNSWSFLWIGFTSLLVSIFVSILFSLLLPDLKGRKAIIWGIALLLPWLGLFLSNL